MITAPAIQRDGKDSHPISCIAGCGEWTNRAGGRTWFRSPGKDSAARGRGIKKGPLRLGEGHPTTVIFSSQVPRYLSSPTIQKLPPLNIIMVATPEHITQGLWRIPGLDPPSLHSSRIPPRIVRTASLASTLGARGAVLHSSPADFWALVKNRMHRSEDIIVVINGDLIRDRIRNTSLLWRTELER